MSRGNKKAEDSFLGKKFQNVTERLDYLEEDVGLDTGWFDKGVEQDARA